MNLKNKQLMFRIVLFFLVGVVFMNMMTEPADEPKELGLNEVKSIILDHRADSVLIFPEEDKLEIHKNAEDVRIVFYPDGYEGELTSFLLENNINPVTKIENPNAFVTFLASMLPIVIILGIFIFLMRRMAGGAGGAIGKFSKAKTKTLTEKDPKVTFADVMGIDEAVENVQQIKNFLENPTKYAAMGAKIPTGVLLYGPPGCGKTLLARAVAGEAGVPFFSISGSDFVEMFVGVGASRVRDVFEKAKENAPAIIFMDEIDAVGRHRGAGLGGGHDEREQTLNQILVEMDGFGKDSGVIMIAATNRPDILDPALRRPGRFDREVLVDRPDLEGRKKILEVHARSKRLAGDVDFDSIAKQTTGFTGADLANLLNEAALSTVENGDPVISHATIQSAIERIVAGPEKKTFKLSEKDKLTVAYHETGHALVGYLLNGADSVQKITIVPSGRALGHTLSLPDEDQYLISRNSFYDRLAMSLGGRAAEELVFKDITTGAGNDIEKATEIAKSMVVSYGMSDVVGPVTLAGSSHEVFLGKQYGEQRTYSEAQAEKVDTEIRRILGSALDDALKLLEKHKDAMDAMVEALLERETVRGVEIERIFGQELKGAYKRDLDTGKVLNL